MRHEIKYNVSYTRKTRIYYFRMFDTKLSVQEIKKIYRWQAVKKLPTKQVMTL